MAKRLTAKIIIDAQTKAATRAISRLKTSVASVGTQAKKTAEGFSALTGKFLAATAVLYSLKKAFDFVKEGADIQAQTEALKRNVETQGVAWEGYIESLKKVSDQQISTKDIVSASSSAMLLGIPATKMAKLMEVAAASATATGRTITESFRDIAIGVGRGSPMILDNLGIVLKLGDVYKKAAKDIGTTVDALTVEEKKMALLNKVLEIGAKRVDLFAGAQGRASRSTQQAVASIEEFFTTAKTGIASFTTDVLTIVDGVESIEEATDKVAQKAKAFQEEQDRLRGRLTGLIHKDIAVLVSGFAELNRQEIEHQNIVERNLISEKMLLELRKEEHAQDVKNNGAVQTAIAIQAKWNEEKEFEAEALKLAIELQSKDTNQKTTAITVHTMYIERAQALVRAKQAEAAAIKATTEAANAEVSAVKTLTASLEELGSVTERSTNEELAKLNGLLAEVERRFIDGAVGPKFYARQTAFLNAEIQRVTDAFDDATRSADEFSEAMGRSSKAERTLEEDLRRLGVTLESDVTKQIKFMEEALDRAADHYGENSDQYKAALKTITERMRVLRGEVVAQAEGFDDAGEAMVRYGQNAVGVSSDLNNLGGAANLAASAVAELNAEQERAQRLNTLNRPAPAFAAGQGTLGTGRFSGFTPVELMSESQWTIFKRLQDIPSGMSKSMWQSTYSQSARQDQWVVEP